MTTPAVPIGFLIRVSSCELRAEAGVGRAHIGTAGVDTPRLEGWLDLATAAKEFAACCYADSTFKNERQ